MSVNERAVSVESATRVAVGPRSAVPPCQNGAISAAPSAAAAAPMAIARNGLRLTTKHR